MTPPYLRGLHGDTGERCRGEEQEKEIEGGESQRSVRMDAYCESLCQNSCGFYYLLTLRPHLTVLKTRGNTAFSQGDYEAAVQFYTEGLQQLRDMLELYTNRAQVTSHGTATSTGNSTQHCYKHR